MSDPAFPKKNEALTRLREALRGCAECGKPYDEVNANSHQTAKDDPGAVRFYFQFLHDGGAECIAFTTAREFDAWLANIAGGQTTT